MSTSKTTTELMPGPVEVPLSMRDLASVLVKHYGIHEGRFDLLVEFQIGTGAVGPDPATLIPGALIGVSRIGLMPSKKDGPTTVDAAIVNPAKKSRKKTAG
ncbi:MAG: hypothetical protein Q8L93_12320 [Rhodocyclaceae bacterium]|nr:hypothetical protein [Rhodocyclaceae bacterium]